METGAQQIDGHRRVQVRRGRDDRTIQAEIQEILVVGQRVLGAVLGRQPPDTRLVRVHQRKDLAIVARGEGGKMS